MLFLVNPLVSNAANAPKFDVNRNRIYNITSAKSGLVMTQDSEGKIVQKAWTESDNQKWEIIPLGDGKFNIKSVTNGKCLHVPEASTEDAIQLIAWSPNGNPNQQWRLVEEEGGSYRIEAVHSGKVLGISGESVIQDSYKGNRWCQISGGLKWVATAADGTVWGVASNDEIYRYQGNNNWEQISGKLKQISVGSANAVWGVNSNDDIYTWTGSKWQQISGKLKCVSVGADGTVWGVASNDEIYHYQGNNEWQQISGKLKQISVGSAHLVWGVNSNDDIYTWTGSKWQQISGKLKCVSVGADGTVWGVASNDEIYHYQGNNEWQQISGKLKQISVGNLYRIWGVNSEDNIYSWGDEEAQNQEWILSEVRPKSELFDKKATVYQHANYGGASQVLGLGSYDIHQLSFGNDQISSVKVPEGLRVTLFEHANFRGGHKMLTSDTSYVGDDFNDTTSGILVEKVASFYEHGSYQGKKLVLGVGRYNMADIEVIGNDQLSSLKVPQGLQVTLYQHADFQGNYLVFDQDEDFLGPYNFNDIASSIIIKAVGIVVPPDVLTYGSTISLKSDHGNWMSARSDGDLNLQPQNENEEKFTVVRAGATKHNSLVSYGDIIALKGVHGKYVTAIYESGEMLARYDHLQGGEKFIITRAGQSESNLFVSKSDLIALKTLDHNLSVTALDNGTIVNRYDHVQAWQQWTVDTAEIPPEIASAAQSAAEAGDGCGAAASIWSAAGVGVCGAAACVADACGAAACGAAAYLFSACGAAATGIAACGIAAAGVAIAGADICGAALGGLTACGADACGGAACGAAACGGAACGAAACGADACGAAACAADACGAAASGGGVNIVGACGAEAGGIDACLADACAANVCGINLCPADACAADACAIDVIPIIPGI